MCDGTDVSIYIVGTHLLSIDRMVQCVVRKIRLDILMLCRHHLINALQRAAHPTGWIFAFFDRRVIGV